MTATTMRPATRRPDIDAVYIEHLRLQMRKYLRLAEHAEASYLARDEVLRRRYPDRTALVIAERDDSTLNNHARNVAFYASMVGMYAQALAGEAAARTLLGGER